MGMLRMALTAAGALTLALPALGAEPTIAEMLKEVNERAKKPTPVETTPATPAADSEYLRTMKARLEYEFNRRLKEKRNDAVGSGDIYFDIQNFDTALNFWNTALQKAPNDWNVRSGWVHHRLCRLYAIKGQKELAKQSLDEALSRAPDPGTRQHFERLQTWLKEYAANEEEAKELKDAKAANSRWKLLVMYREAYPMRLDEFIELIKFRETYPKDPRVTTGGEADWRLMEVFMGYGMTDEAMKLAEGFREKFPKSGTTTYGDPLWRLGEWSGWLGRNQDALAYYKELREKHPKHWASERGEAAWRMGEICLGFKRWQEAMDLYKEVRDKYKDHWTNHPAPGQQARIVERIFECGKNGAK